MHAKLVTLILSLVFTSCMLFSCAQTSEIVKDEPQSKSNLYNTALERLKDEIKNGDVLIEEYQDVLTINVVDRIFFDSGKSDLKPASYTVLNKIGRILKDVPNTKMIQVEGHTDDVPIGKELGLTIPNNWALGASRAIKVAEYLRISMNIDPRKLSVLSFSQYRPIMANTSEVNRAKNRRIEFVILNQNIYQAMELNIRPR